MAPSDASETRSPLFPKVCIASDPLSYLEALITVALPRTTYSVFRCFHLRSPNFSRTDDFLKSAEGRPEERHIV